MARENKKDAKSLLGVIIRNLLTGFRQLDSKTDTSKQTSIVSNFGGFQMGVRRTRQEVENKIKLAFLTIKIFLRCFGDALQVLGESFQKILSTVTYSTTLYLSCPTLLQIF